MRANAGFCSRDPAQQGRVCYSSLETSAASTALMNVLRSALIALAVFALQSIALGQSADESTKPPDGSAKQDEVGTGSGDANSEAPPTAAAQTSSGTDLRASMCLMIESAARANGPPLEFFARVIWQQR